MEVGQCGGPGSRGKVERTLTCCDREREEAVTASPAGGEAAGVPPASPGGEYTDWALEDSNARPEARLGGVGAKLPNEGVAMAEVYCPAAPGGRFPACAVSRTRALPGSCGG